MCIVVDFEEGSDGKEMEGHVLDSLGQVLRKECVLHR